LLLLIDCNVWMGVHGQHGHDILWLIAERVGQWAFREWCRPWLTATYFSASQCECLAEVAQFRCIW